MCEPFLINYRDTRVNYEWQSNCQITELEHEHSNE